MNYFEYNAYTDYITCRRNHLKFSVENGFLKNFANSTEKHLCWSVFLIKLVKTLLKRDFPVKFAKSLKMPTFGEHLPKTVSVYEIGSYSMLVSGIIFCILLQWTKRNQCFKVMIQK